MSPAKRAGTLRVIAGNAGGRLLRAPRNASLRPTTDLVRGAIFSMLEAEAYRRGFEPDEEGRLASGLAWPHVLDLFAGTGALGIEALSRGAARATFVEQDRDAIAAIQFNVANLGFESRATILSSSVGPSLARLTTPIDAVFLDPPYGDTDLLTGAIRSISEHVSFSDRAVGILEQGAEATAPETIGALILRHSRTHGRTRVSFYAAE